MIEPYLPQAAEKILSFFGLRFARKSPGSFTVDEGTGISWKDLGTETGISQVVKSEVLFAKLEDDVIAILRERYSGSQKERQESAEQNAPATKEINVSDSAAPAAMQPAVQPTAPAFAATLDLRVAKIVKIERHPKADKLYIETLEIARPDGTLEERIIVSGLVPFFTEDQLLGKSIIVAYNLKAAKLRGVESRGMLLAASDHNGPEGAERVEVLDAGETPTGTRVTLEGAPVPVVDLPEIDIDTFFKVPITVNNNTVLAEGKALTLNNVPIKTSIISPGEVH
jgi:methionyl-tRNA synthetase